MKKTSLILILIISFSCSNYDREVDIEQKAQEAIFSVTDFLKKKRISPFCITERPEAIIRVDRVTNDSIMIYLSIQDSAYFWNQIKKQKSFSITKEMVPEGVIILSDESINIDEELNYIKNVDEIEFLDRECATQFTSITKPIFNEDLTKMFVETAYYCGWNCQGTNGLIFEFRDEKWEIAEPIYSWSN